MYAVLHSAAQSHSAPAPDSAMDQFKRKIGALTKKEGVQPKKTAVAPPSLRAFPLKKAVEILRFLEVFAMAVFVHKAGITHG